VQGKQVKTQTAVVAGCSGDKSIRVVIDYKVKHPRYGKYVRKRTTLGVHDEHNEAAAGDKIEIAQSRPHSKAKRWRLVRVVAKAAQQ